jgi:lipopolysaccharide export system protein LptA
LKTFTFSPLFALVLCVAASSAMAERADRGKPMNIEADSLRYDDVNQVSVFRGNVVVSKGSIQIRGNQIEVRQDPEGYQHGVVTGSPQARAFFRQKRDGVNETMEGEAETLEYDGKADTIKFVKQAELRRLRGAAVVDEISGAVIVYENLTDRLSVDGSVGAPVAGSLPGRIKAMLMPRPDNAALTPAPTQAPAPANLRLTPALGGSAK